MPWLLYVRLSTTYIYYLYLDVLCSLPPPGGGGPANGRLDACLPPLVMTWFPGSLARCFLRLPL